MVTKCDLLSALVDASNFCSAPLGGAAINGGIVWNAHNTVFGSKRSAICALAVYFVHSTRPKIQGLVSRDSIVDRHFVTTWVREWVTNIRFLCHAVPTTVVRRRRKFGAVSCTECTEQWNDFELIPMVTRTHQEMR